MSKTTAIHTYRILVQSHQQQCLMNDNYVLNMSSTLGNTTSTDAPRSANWWYWHIKMLLSVVSYINQLIQRVTTENKICTEEMKMPSSCKSLKAQSKESVTFCEEWKTSQHVSLSLFPLQLDMNCNTVHFCNVLQQVPTYCIITLTYVFTHNASLSEGANHKNSRPICLLFYYTINA